MKKILVAAPVALVLALPLVAFADTPHTLKELVGMLVNLLNTATGVLVALALVAFLYGAAYNMMKAGERGGTALRQFLVWGIIILFVMVSIWGILNLLQQTLFGAGGSQQGATQTTGSNTSGSNIQFAP